MKQERSENKAVVVIAEVLLMEHDQQFVHRRGWGLLVPFLLL